MIRVYLLFLFLLCLLGCSAHKKTNLPQRIQKLKNLTVIPADAKPAYQIHFKQNATYGGTKTSFIGNIGSVAISDSGRVFIGNPNQGMFFVYTPHGSFLSRLGGKGRGPGKFSYFANPNVIDNKLYVYDLSLRRISVFSMNSLDLIRTINLKPANQASIEALHGYGLHYVYPRPGGVFLAEFSPNHIAKMNPDSLYKKYFLINDHGKVISHQIFEQKGVGAGLLAAKFGGRYQGGAFKFVPRSLKAFSNDRHIFAAWSAYFLIKEYNSEGKYLRGFYYPFKKVPLSKKEAMIMQNARGNAKYFQKVLRHVDLPKTWPALHALKVDNQSRLWVATIIKNQKVYEWWVLDKAGKLLARFKWPRDKPIQQIKNDYVYTKETNTKTGVERIVRYKIMMQ